MNRLARNSRAGSRYLQGFSLFGYACGPSVVLSVQVASERVIAAFVSERGHEGLPTTEILCLCLTDWPKDEVFYWNFLEPWLREDRAIVDDQNDCLFVWFEDCNELLAFLRRWS